MYPYSFRLKKHSCSETFTQTNVLVLQYINLLKTKLQSYNYASRFVKTLPTGSRIFTKFLN